jgi:hypothetical protein
MANIQKKHEVRSGVNHAEENTENADAKPLRVTYVPWRLL